MSSSTTISRALMALSLTFTFGLVTSAAAVEAETGAPFSAASDPQVGYTPGTLATLLPIEVRVLVGGENEILAGDCHAAQVGTNPLNRRLVCPGLGAAPMTLVKQSPRLTYDVNLHGFVLAPGLAGEFRGAVLLDDDNYETMPVVATYDWFWGLHCELEASDYQDWSRPAPGAPEQRTTTSRSRSPSGDAPEARQARPSV